MIESVRKPFRDFGGTNEFLARDTDGVLYANQAGLALRPNIIDDKVFDEETKQT